MNIEVNEVDIVLGFMEAERRANRKGLRLSLNRTFFIARDAQNRMIAACDTLATLSLKLKAYKPLPGARGPMKAKPQQAGLALVGRRIDAAVKRAQARDAKPKRPTPAALLREAKLKGLTK